MTGVVGILGGAIAGFFVGYHYHRAAGRAGKPEQPLESYGWVGSPMAEAVKSGLVAQTATL
jgi:hypothetical protein